MRARPAFAGSTFINHGDAPNDPGIVPAVINCRNLKAYGKSPAQTDFRLFPDRTHWIIAQDGWDEVAAHISTWLDGVGLPPT